MVAVVGRPPSAWTSGLVSQTRFLPLFPAVGRPPPLNVIRARAQSARIGLSWGANPFIVSRPWCMNNTLVIVPTYNERENLPMMAERLLRLPLPVGLLVVDDNSPDGTGRIAHQLAPRPPHLPLLHSPPD